jgi:TonB family protein
MLFKSILRFSAIVCLVVAPLIAQESGQSPSQATAGTDSKVETPSRVLNIISDSPEQNLIRAADQAVRARDYSTAAQLLEKLTATDPNYRNAWNYLGWTYNSLGQYEKAEVALRKAIAVDPADPKAYNNLGQALAFQKKYGEAISQYQKQIEINPKDQWAHANLGRIYVLTKQYEKAIGELEIAGAISPGDPSIPFNLGRAYAKTNEPENAAKALEKSVQLQPIPMRWNSVAYEMAVNGLDLEKAEEYAQAAIAATVLQMRDTSLEHLTREDAYQASRIASYWDTWGWIRFQKNDLPMAENYVRCSWMVHSLAVNSDHLGQIYEKLGRKSDALRMYQMALASDPSGGEMRERLAALAGPDAKIDQLIEEGRSLLKESRTIAVKNSHQLEGFAEFWILSSPGPKVLGVKFVTGDEELTPLAKDLEELSYPNFFPEATEMRLLRRGRLACSRSSPDCHLQMISSLNVQTDELAATLPSVAGDVGRLLIGGSVAAAKLINRVQPIYPVLARQTGIQGVVKLHAILGKDGTVQQLQVLSGHPLLVQAALDAVRQWIYQPTLLEGKPVEVDTEIDVFFQLQQKPQ